MKLIDLFNALVVMSMTVVLVAASLYSISESPYKVRAGIEKVILNK